jgi:hypothetical protein
MRYRKGQTGIFNSNGVGSKRRDRVFETTILSAVDGQYIVSMQHLYDKSERYDTVPYTDKTFEACFKPDKLSKLEKAMD